MTGLSSKVITTGVRLLASRRNRTLGVCSGILYKGPAQHRCQSTKKPAVAAVKRPNSRTESRSNAQAPASHKQPTDSTDDKFYKYYLYDMPNKPSKIDPTGAWLEWAEFDAGKSSLPVPLRERPLEFFDPLAAPTSGLLDLYTAQLCLERYIAKTAVGRSKEDMREQFASPNDLPGTKALSWLRQDYDRADLSDNVGFLRALVYCLSAEGGEEQVWRWLELEHNPAILSHQQH
ncbi:unnamed protein product [Zymoseptoria tritici ST99CH_3D7]|uniref:Uncharacterized protein n=1 Tax=Zymoseptoria tritici (strain ST99CH_3D7) TaxID=1276538 RepID=A0A1X7S3R9_ZYMT9|nr:unnamed protein product [Zymoseptoria tritici ST99CH_3D7]